LGPFETANPIHVNQFQKHCLIFIFKFRLMGKVHNPNYSKCYTLSLESLRFHHVTVSNRNYRST
jgi:hypothetical protein